MDFLGKYNKYCEKIIQMKRKRLPIIIFLGIGLALQSCYRPNTTMTRSHSIIYGLSLGHAKTRRLPIVV